MMVAHGRALRAMLAARPMRRRPARATCAMPGAAEMAARMKQMCQDRYAREAGQLAYLEASLDLTAARAAAVRPLERASSSTSPSAARPIAASP